MKGSNFCLTIYTAVFTVLIYEQIGVTKTISVSTVVTEVYFVWSHARLHLMLSTCNYTSLIRVEGSTYVRKSVVECNVQHISKRHIPNLPLLSKILEKVVATCLESYLSTQKLHDNLHSAYPKHHFRDCTPEGPSRYCRSLRLEIHGSTNPMRTIHCF